MFWRAVGYEPTPEQRAFHRSEASTVLGLGGWSAGKTVLIAMEIAPHMAIATEKKKTFHLIGKTFREPRYEFQHILDSYEKQDPCPLTKGSVSTPSVGEWSMEIAATNSRLVTVSSDDPASIRGFESDGAGLCEVGIIDFETFENVTGRLVRTGGFLLGTGTLEDVGRRPALNWFPDYWKLGQGPNDIGLESFSIPSWTNTYKFPGGRDDPQILLEERRLGPDRFMEKYGAIPCPPSGRVHPEASVAVHVMKDEMERWLHSPERRQDDLYIAIDPGREYGYAVEVIQIVNDTVYVIDEIYEQEAHIPTYAGSMIALARQSPWWPRVVGGTIDVAARSHVSGSPVPEATIWEREGRLPFKLNAQMVRIPDGITRMRDYLMPNPVTREPKMYISRKCKGFLGELGLGPPKFPNGGVYKYQTGTDKPIDLHNHACKAVSYFLVAHFGYAERRRIRPMLQVLGGGSPAYAGIGGRYGYRR